MGFFREGLTPPAPLVTWRLLQGFMALGFGRFLTGRWEQPVFGRCGRPFEPSARRLPAVAPSVVPSLPRRRTRGGGNAVTTEVDPAGVRNTGLTTNRIGNAGGDRFRSQILAPSCPPRPHVCARETLIIACESLVGHPFAATSSPVAPTEPSTCSRVSGSAAPPQWRRIASNTQGGDADSTCPVPARGDPLGAEWHTRRRCPGLPWSGGFSQRVRCTSRVVDRLW